MNRKTKPTTGQGQEKFQEMKIIFIFFISGGLSVLVMQRYIESLGIVNRVIVNVL